MTTEANGLKAARYRNQAAQLLKLAVSEPPAGELRRRLLDLAQEYHQMAAALEA